MTADIYELHWCAVRGISAHVMMCAIAGALKILMNVRAGR